MARKSRLLQVLRLAEDLLIFFDDYFKSTKWVYDHAGLSRQAKYNSKRYLLNNDIIKDDFSLDIEGKSIYASITKPWDEKWRMVSFDIPEKNRKLRNKIRYVLKEYDFKNLQRSLWVSPLPVERFIDRIRKRLDDPNHLIIIVGGLKGISSKSLVNQLWNLEDWQERGESLIDKIEKSSQVGKDLEKEFWSLVIDHPKVPLALLPSNWPLNRLAAAFVDKIDG